LAIIDCNQQFYCISLAVIGSLQIFTSILKIWLQSIQAFDQTEFLLLFDRISIAVTADDNTETCDTFVIDKDQVFFNYGDGLNNF
jgi:hypothetical protein